MANCTQCGAELKDGIRFCTECGAAAPVTQTSSAQEVSVTPPQAQPISQPQAAPNSNYTPPQPTTPPVYQATPAYAAPASDVPPAGSKYELISTGGFIGIMLLMCIPVVGQLLMIIWACGGCRKLQKRNLARAALIMTIAMLIISLLLGFAVKRLVNNVMEDIGITQSERGGALDALFGSDEKDSDSGGILGIFGALDGGSVENGDLDELQELLGQMEGLTG